jgi:hypothetical protein
LWNGQISPLAMRSPHDCERSWTSTFKGINWTRRPLSLMTRTAGRSAPPTTLRLREQDIRKRVCAAPAITGDFTWLSPEYAQCSRSAATRPCGRASYLVSGTAGSVVAHRRRFGDTVRLSAGRRNDR